MKKRSIIALLTLATGILTMQGAGANEAAIEYRQAVMNVYLWNLKPMAGMVKGKIPFDAKLFRSRAEGLATATRLDLLSGFPEGSTDEFDSSAKPVIWEKWPEFKGKFEALRRESAKLAEAARSGDAAAMKAQFGNTAKSCGGCHKKFRMKK